MLAADSQTVIESTKEAREEHGLCWGDFGIDLSESDIEALNAGKTIAVQINQGEYSIFIYKRGAS